MRMRGFPLLAIFFSVFRGEHNRFAVFLLIPIFFLYYALVSGQAEQQTEERAWVGTFNDGSPLTQETLDDLVAEHNEWLETAGEEIENKCGNHIILEKYWDCLRK